MSNTKSQNFRRRSLRTKPALLRDNYQSMPSQVPSHTMSQFRFLSDLVKKKQEVQTTQIIQRKISKDYQYYDVIVRDLISQIRTRNTQQYNPKPQQKIMVSRPSPIKYSTSVKSIKNHIQHMTLSPPKQKMLFSMSLNGSDHIYQRKITTYIQFLYKLNFCNSIYVDLSLSSPKTIYKVKVGLGNNGMLIRSLLKRRFWLQLVTSGQSHFAWTQLTDHSLHQSQPNTKQKQSSQSRPPRRLKLMSNTSAQHQLKIMNQQQMHIANEWYQRSDWGKISPYPTIQPSVITNHLPINCIIGAKRILFRVVRWYYQHVLQADPYQVLPKTFNFQPGGVDLKSFIDMYSATTKVWIVKPGENTNRGRGIKVVQTAQLLSILNKQKNGPPLIVQQYLKPFLYFSRKFDIRHYLLITSHSGHLRAYWFHQGYLRTSSQKYDIQDQDQMIHLTNDAIQKHGERYGKYQAANKVSYSQFQRYLDSNFPHKHYNFGAVVQKMKSITRDLIRGAFQFMDPNRKQNNFQLYGLDFYISSKFKPYLIQCNANPCLQINCPILERLIPCAVQHALRIGLDPLLPPPGHYPPQQRYQLCDRVMEKIKYQLIFDQKWQGAELRQKSKELIGKLDLGGGLRCQEDVFQDQGEELGEGCVLD